MNWIKLEDQKPEIGQLVVVNFDDNDKVVARYNKNVNGESEFLTRFGGAKDEKITHWLAIPDNE